MEIYRTKKIFIQYIQIKKIYFIEIIVSITFHVDPSLHIVETNLNYVISGFNVSWILWLCCNFQFLLCNMSYLLLCCLSTRSCNSPSLSISSTSLFASTILPSKSSPCCLDHSFRAPLIPFNFSFKTKGFLPFTFNFDQVLREKS